MESVLCRPTTSWSWYDLSCCVYKSLKVMLHWRNLIFFSPARIDCIESWLGSGNLCPLLFSLLAFCLVWTHVCLLLTITVSVSSYMRLKILLPWSQPPDFYNLSIFPPRCSVACPSLLHLVVAQSFSLTIN